MSLFDDVIVNAAAAVDAVGKRATEVVDRSRIRVSSAELKSKISAQFETLGRYVYDTSVTGTTNNEIVNQYVTEISTLIGELKSLQDSLNETNSKVICPKCHCSNSYDSFFCKKCGTSLDFTNIYTMKTPIPQPVQNTPKAEPVQTTTTAPIAEEPTVTNESAVESTEVNSQPAISEIERPSDVIDN